jgi:asparagine synthase (glutamine-hydrolysing)
MCGIFGWVGEAPEGVNEHVSVLSRMLQHRGPDDAGYESGPGWGLGFRRLSILDLSPLGHQPMTSPDGRYWIIFNGEVYNYVELREMLEREGETFRSGSDTEVLVRLLAREGTRALERLNGMYAFAFVDTQERTFLIVRDRLGVKPLYYQHHNGSLRFASELKALLAWPDAPRAVDPAAVVEYLALNYLPHERCIFQGYEKLPPGHYLTGSLDDPRRARVGRYWQPTLEPQEGASTLSNAQLEELLALLTDATRIRLRSDVPVGIFLSGGIDSGLVAVLAGQAAEGAKPLALTVGFSERDYDESDFARATAERAGLEHRLIMQQPASLTDVDRLAWFYDEPFGDASALPSFALCEAAREHATVFIAGDGGDEAFGGYRRYIEAQRYRSLAALPQPLTSAMRGISGLLPALSPSRYRLLKSGLADGGYAAAFDGVPTDPALELVLGSDLRAHAGDAGKALWQRWGTSRGKDILTRQQALDYSLYLPDDILVKMDRASMAHSIEVRSPFLDYRVVEWAARLPRAALLDTREGKLPLRALAKQLLPPQVERGRKRGFGIPLRAWFQQPTGQAFLRERLLSSEARTRGYWDLSGVKRVIEAHATDGGRDFGPLLWRLLMLDAWSRSYVDSDAFLRGAPSAGGHRATEPAAQTSPARHEPVLM